MKRLRLSILAAILVVFTFSISCSEDEVAIDNMPPKVDDDMKEEEEAPLATINMEETHQSMIGFGGALTWFCDRITRSNKKDEIIDVIVNDLGIDMLRLKNWYYPVDYPVNKLPNQMEIDWFIYHHDATNELYDLVKTANPQIKVLFSSWGPPSSLKSNGQLDRGTLKKENGDFMYDAYATYWEDVFDNITFVPDYLSIQNEPTWLADWETCEWSPTETVSLPGYEIAFDKVAEKINLMETPPIMVGPESANLSSSAFDDFAEELKDNPYLGVYGYHPYNFNNGSSLTEIQSVLTAMGDNFSDRPNIMTEYDGLDWIKTAQFINSTLRDANTSAYLYWTLMWDENSTAAMIKVDGNGDYERTKYFHLLKHYAKYVDEGDIRISITANDESLDLVSFINPEKNKITVISVNPNSEDITLDLEVVSETILQVNSFQSEESSPFNEIETEVGESIVLKGESITTTILEI